MVAAKFARPGAVLWKVLTFLLVSTSLVRASESAEQFFKKGIEACHDGEYVEASKAFQKSASQQPAAGTLMNLGIAEWRRGRAGAAIVAWEQSAWLDPFNASTRNNLAFARRIVETDAPDLAWHEVISVQLSPAAWAWLSCGGLWLGTAMLTLPHVLRWRKAGWHQALAAVSAGVFLLTLPAHVGIATRSNVGFVLDKKTPLRLTPTEEAEVVTTLAGGEPARRLRSQGDYVYVKTQRGNGWARRDQLGMVCRHK